MFGEKEKISIEISKDLYEEAKTLLKEQALDLQEVINLFLLKSIEDNTLSIDSDFIKDRVENRNRYAEIYLEKELKKGRDSYTSLEIKTIDILL